MGWIKKVVEKADRAADKGIEEVVAKEVPPRREKKPPATPKPTTGGFVHGLGERIGFAGIVAFTLGAALFGAVGCNEAKAVPSTPTAGRTCDEPVAPECHRGDAAEVRR